MVSRFVSDLNFEQEAQARAEERERVEDRSAPLAVTKGAKRSIPVGLRRDLALGESIASATAELVATREKVVRSEIASLKQEIAHLRGEIERAKASTPRLRAVSK